MNDQQAAALRPANNPAGQPTGHFTGRCGRCASTDLWDDNLAYGCNCCGAFWTGMEPQLVACDPGAAIGDQTVVSTLDSEAGKWIVLDRTPLPRIDAPSLDDLAARAREAVQRHIEEHAYFHWSMHRAASREIEFRLQMAISSRSRAVRAMFAALEHHCTPDAAGARP